MVRRENGLKIAMIGMGYVGNAAARASVAQLIRDTGFEPIDTGSLEAACLFDPGQPAYNHPMSASEMRRTLSKELVP